MVALAESLEMRRMTVKLDAELIKQAKMVAADREVSVIDYIESIIGPVVRRDLDAVVTKLSRSQAEPAPKRPKKGE